MKLISADKILRIQSAKIKSVAVWDRLIFDNRLSHSTRLVHCMFKALSERPGWKLTLNGVATICKVSRQQMWRYTRDLKNYGYLESDRIQDEKGKWIGWLWTVYPIPKKEYKRLMSATDVTFQEVSSDVT